MNSQSFRPVPSFIKLVVFALSFFMQVHVKAWEVDLSRRNKDLESQSKAFSKPVQDSSLATPMDVMMDVTTPSQEIVIMNTEKGFVPETVRVKKNSTYKISIVNVNDKEKNVSFMLDAFNEHHGTYFGQPKTFTLSPKVDGVFTFVCPETAHTGHLVIVSEGDSRKPASESK